MNELQKLLKNYSHRLEEPEALVMKEINREVKPLTTNGINTLLITLIEYSAGVNNRGVNILSKIVNNTTKHVLHQGYVLETKAIEYLQKKNKPLIWSFANGQDYTKYDTLGFSSYFELQLFNVRGLLESTDIPLYSEDRTEKDPIIYLGGISAYTAMPFYKYFDVIFYGDGEKQLVEYLNILEEEKGNRHRALERVRDEVAGAYVPLIHKKGKKITRRVEDLNEVYNLTSPILPLTELSLTGYSSLEISRGCSNGCRYCMAGFINRPYRERDINKLRLDIKTMIKGLGTGVLIPYSFDTDTYSQLKDIGNLVQAEGYSCNKASQRVSDFTLQNLLESKDFGQRRITFSLESASERIRKALNKGLSDFQLYYGLYALTAAEYRSLRIYMIENIPGETKAERDNIFKILDTYMKFNKAEVDYNDLDMQLPFYYVRLKQKNIFTKEELLMFDPIFDYLLDLKNKDNSIWESIFNTSEYKTIKDYLYFKIKDNNKILRTQVQLTLSYTPFTKKPVTPLYYAKVNPEGFFPEEYFKHLRKYGVQYKKSLKKEDNLLLNMLSGLGKLDFEKVKKWNIIGGFYTNATKIYYEDILNEYRTEEPHNEVHQLLDNIPTEKWLKGEYNKFLNALETPDCLTRCTNCGGCETQRITISPSLLKPIETTLNYDSKKRVLLKVKTKGNNVYNRYIAKDKQSILIRSYLEKMGNKIYNVKSFSHKVFYKDWVTGERLFIIDLINQDTLKLTSNELGLYEVIEVLDKVLDREQIRGYYKINIPKDFKYLSRAKLEEFREGKQYTFKQKIAGYKKSTVMNAEVTGFCKLEDIDKNNNIYFTLDVNLDPYEFLANILDIYFTYYIREFKIERLCYYRIPEGGLFGNVCNCGKEIALDQVQCHVCKFKEMV